MMTSRFEALDISDTTSLSRRPLYICMSHGRACASKFPYIIFITILIVAYSLKRRKRLF